MLCACMRRERHRPHLRFRTKSVRRLRAWVALLSLCTLIVAVLVAGQRYFYCPMMDRSAFTACCDHGEEADQGEEAPSVAVTDLVECCEDREIEGNAPFGLHKGPPPLFAPVVAILPPLFAMPDGARLEPDETAWIAIRAGPSPSEARATLQVFLC